MSLANVNEMTPIDTPQEPEETAAEGRVEFDLNGWVREMRAKTGLSQDKFAEKIQTDPGVIGMAENRRRRVTPGLVARITYAMMRDDPLGALEMMWTAEMEERIEIPRRQFSDAWVYELKPLADSATPDALALAVHLMKVTLENYAVGAAQRGRLSTDN